MPFLSTSSYALSDNVITRAELHDRSSADRRPCGRDRRAKPYRCGLRERPAIERVLRSATLDRFGLRDLRIINDNNCITHSPEMIMDDEIIARNDSIRRREPELEMHRKVEAHRRDAKRFRAKHDGAEGGKENV